MIDTFGVRDAHLDFWNYTIGLEIWKSKAHTLCPFIVVTPEKVSIYHKTKDLLDEHYPDDTLIIKAWPGQWSTDYFRFTLKEYKEHLAN